MQKSHIFIFISILFLYFLTMGLYYHQTHEIIIKDTENNIENMLLTRRALSHLVSDLQKSEINRLKDTGTLDKNYFSAELLSSSYITLKLNHYVNKQREKLNLDSLYFKYASPNPTNPTNLANDYELSLYNKMNNQKLNTFKEEITQDGKNYLYYAIAGRTIEAKCLQCHGKVEDAPKMLIDRYGKDHGFNLKVGDLSSIISVKVPLDHIYTQSDKQFYQAALIILCVFILLSFFAHKITSHFKDKEEELSYATLQHAKSHEKAQALESSLENLYEHLISSKFDVEGKIIEASEALLKLCEYSKDELIGKSFCYFKHPDTKENLFRDIWSSLMKGEEWRGEIQCLSKSGKIFWIETFIHSIKNEHDIIIAFESIMRTITDKKALLADINLDPLTQLLNRRSFEKHFYAEASRAKRDQKYFALFMIDIDFFKQYNDFYGHLEGDKALQKVSASLQNSFRRSCDIVFRLGGEEFAVLTSEKSKEKIIESAKNACFSLYKESIPHIKSNITPWLTISLGVALISETSKINLEDAYKQSDKALYMAKESGRNKIDVLEL
ncbi:diguanylate cyclase [Sulfurimonas sp. MAG313]|nr:diguanylate cyclase [Sulfurimonas sp. MAG313]MDF1880359.1 diguanylate cyclase [Sulfurimonas sp. MAG313]